MSSRTIPASLAHFLIFNPNIKPPSRSERQKGVGNAFSEDTAVDSHEDGVADTAKEEERDRDLEDDLKEAAQILFYTSRSSRTVSRDTMLKQTSMIKGAMGFTDMLDPPPRPEDPDHGSEDGYISIKMGKSRMIGIEVEKDFHVVVNVTLAVGVDENGKRDSSGAQGLSDRSIVKALQRGYEDFRLLYGTFESLPPPSATLSSTLERFWTRFAFTFEDQIITPPPSLITSLPAHITPEQNLAHGVQRALEVYIEDIDLSPEVDYGVITQHGPVYSSTSDPALHRFLTSLVVGSLPPSIEVNKDTRHTLGLGKNSVRNRTSSWGLGGIPGMGWVPTLPGMTPRSITPVSADPAKENSSTTPQSGPSSDQLKEGKESKGKWGFGMGMGMPSLGLGEAMGSVGGVFGLSGSGGTASKQAERNLPERPASIKTTDTDPSTESATARVKRLHASDTASIVTQTDVDVEELEAAVQQTPEVDLGWEKRSVFISSGHEGGPAKRRLTWTMRDSILLFILFPESTTPPYVIAPTRPTLALYSRINAILAPDTTSKSDPVSGSPRHASQDAAVLESRESTEAIGPSLDAASSASLLEIQDLMKSDRLISEVYARTSAGKFIASKKLSYDTGPVVQSQSIHMLVGRKDANLPDAEHAMRTLLRSRQDVVT